MSLKVYSSVERLGWGGGGGAGGFLGDLLLRKSDHRFSRFRA